MATALLATTAACSTSRDTQGISATESPKNTVVPSTSIVIGSVPTTTTIPELELTSVPATQDTLTALLGQFASDPALINQISALASGSADIGSIANLVGIDLSQIESLGLNAEQIAAIAQTVAASPAEVLSQLSGIVGGGALDPGVLIGILTSSLDINALAQGAVGALVQVLAQSLGGIKVEVTPQLTIQLSELLDEIDPDGLGSLAADPTNAALLALITSAVISANPLLAAQLLANPLLDPGLKELLVQLQDVSASLSETARAALLLAISQVFPGLIP